MFRKWWLIPFLFLAYPLQASPLLDNFDNDGYGGHQTGYHDGNWFESHTPTISIGCTRTVVDNHSWSFYMNYSRSAGREWEFVGGVFNNETNESDWSVYQYISFDLICPDTILIKIQDTDLDETDGYTILTDSTNQWRHVKIFFSDLTLNSCDLTKVNTIFFFPAGGSSSAAGIVYIDNICLGENPELNLRNGGLKKWIF